MEPKKTSRTRVVPGKVVADGLAGPGSGVLEVACWTPGKGESSGGVELRLGNYNHANEGRGDGYEELFVRYYIKFDGSYRGVANHGANLGGRDVSRPGSAWAGQAAIRDIASRGYFYSGLQPYGKNDSRELEMGFYNYHLDKHDQWGDEYPVQKHVPIRVGQWHCVERHLKLNSVTAAGEANTDGLEELWVDGQLSIQKAVRFRRTQKLRITFFSLGTYYHGLPKDYDAAHPITVYFDNLVIARKYIGPIAGKAAAPTEGACWSWSKARPQDGCEEKNLGCWATCGVSRFPGSGCRRAGREEAGACRAAVETEGGLAGRRRSSDGRFLLGRGRVPALYLQSRLQAQGGLRVHQPQLPADPQKRSQRPDVVIQGCEGLTNSKETTQ